MNNTDQTIDTLFKLHNDLWDHKETIEYFGYKYKVRIADHKGFASVSVPGKDGKPILYITQNMRKSTYGSLQIAKDIKNGFNTRITWIVDFSNNQFTYIGVIKTTKDFSLIERYTPYGTQVLYHSDPNFKPTKSTY